jgi:hypothetical protein
MFTFATMWALLAAVLVALGWELRRTVGERRLRGPRKQSVRLELLGLEPRIAPAVFTWVGGAAGNTWTNQANWAGNNGVPGAGDTAIFNAGNQDAVLPAGSPLPLWAHVQPLASRSAARNALAP